MGKGPELATARIRWDSLKKEKRIHRSVGGPGTEHPMYQPRKWRRHETFKVKRGDTPRDLKRILRQVQGFGDLQFGSFVDRLTSEELCEIAGMIPTRD